MKKAIFFTLLLYFFNHLTSIEYNVRSYSLEDGLSDQSVFFLFEDSKGIIWAGSYSGGLNKYDGEKFVHFTKKDGLPSILVTSIAEDSVGNIWFDSDRGLTKYDGTMFTNYPFNRGSQSRVSISKIKIDNNNNLWFSTKDGLAHFDQKSEKFSFFNEKQYSEKVFSLIDTVQKNNKSIASILEVGDNENICKKFNLSKSKEVLIIALGENPREKMDYGWLETKSVIWDQSKQHALHAGGSSKNKISIDLFSLTAGEYRLNYRSNDYHSTDFWSPLGPSHPELWGISLYEVTDNFKNQLQKVFQDTLPSYISNNNIEDIHIDENGIIWIATLHGLNRFDPITGEFKCYFHNPDDSNSLSNNSVTSICKADNHHLWIGTFDGLNKFHPVNGSFESFFADSSKTNSLSNNRIKKLYTSRNGILYIGHNDGIIDIYKDNSFQNLFRENEVIKNGLSDIIEDREGNIWFSSFSGIYIFDGGIFRNFTYNENYESNWIWTVVEDNSQNILFGHPEGGIVKLDGSNFVEFPVTDKIIYSSLVDIEGNLWFGADNEIFVHDGDDFIHYTSENGLKSLRIQKMIQDRYGNVWVAGLSGINIFPHRKIKETSHNNVNPKKLFLHLSTDDGLAGNFTNSVLEDHSGNIWIATSTGLSKLKLDKELNSLINSNFSTPKINFQNFDEVNGLKEKFINSIFEDSNYNLWLGTQGSGIMKFDGKNITAHYTMEKGLADNVVFSIMEDRENNLWIGTKGGGVSKFDGEYFSNYIITNSLLADRIMSIYSDHHQNIWLATGQGLIRYDNQMDKQKQIPPSIFFENIQELN